MTRGIDIRESSGQIVFRASLKSSAGAKVTTGTTEIRLYEVQNDGMLKTYDFNDHTFKSTACTDDEQEMTHRAANNGAVDTGLWTYVLSTLTGFTVGAVYVVQVTNSGASPESQEREFQFGGVEGSQSTLTAAQAETASAAAIAAAGIATEAKQDEILAAIASAGVGARTCVITVDDGSTALESARVRVTKGAESWLQTTDASGQATFNLDDGSWTVAITLAGYTFSGDTLVVDGNETETYSMTAAGFTPSVEPDSVTVRWRVKGKDRATVGAGEATVYVAVQDGPGTAGEIWSGHEDSDTTDANGYVEFTNVPIPCTLLVRAGADGVAREVAIPATAKSPYNAGELTNQDVD